MSMLLYNKQCPCCYTRSNVYAAIQEPMTMLLFKIQYLCCYTRINHNAAIQKAMSMLLCIQERVTMLQHNQWPYRNWTTNKHNVKINELIYPDRLSKKNSPANFFSIVQQGEITRTWFFKKRGRIGRDRFHWAATPLKPYKVGNICYMTYRYSVLYFLNMSFKKNFPHRKRQFLWKYQNPETVIVPCFNVSRMPNRRTSQSKIEDIVHCKCISLLN